MKPLKLKLENCWSIPKENIAFLDEGLIFVELKNNSTSTIKIKKIRIRFQAEEGFLPFEISEKTPIELKPKNIVKVEFPFIAELQLKHYTNTYSILVNFEQKNIKNSITFTNTPSNYIVIHSIRPIKKKIFISHKDPDDTLLGEKLNLLLAKIGFKGYLAENDRRPGLNIWKDKIYPTINESTAVIVLWTPNAFKNPGRILREVKYAKKKQKTIILLTEKGIKIPRTFPRKKEYVRIKGKIMDRDLIELVIDIEKTYKIGGYN